MRLCQRPRRYSYVSLRFLKGACYAELAERRKQVAQSVGQDSNQESDIAAILAPGEPGICHGTDTPRSSGRTGDSLAMDRSAQNHCARESSRSRRMNGMTSLPIPMISLYARCSAIALGEDKWAVSCFHYQENDRQAFELGLRICYGGATRQVKTDLFGTLPGSHAHDSSLANLANGGPLDGDGAGDGIIADVARCDCALTVWTALHSRRTDR